MFFDDFIFAVANRFFRSRNKALVKNYRHKHGRWPDVANPQRYTERMLWRKVVDHNPLFVLFSDKLATKEYVHRICPDLAIPRTLWVGNDADAIPDELLRGEVYVKASHGCDFNLRIRGGRYDRAALKQLTTRWLNSVYGTDSGQWAYAQVKPALFVEEAVGDSEAGMIEFNVRAANGRAGLGSLLGRCKTPDQWVIYLDAQGKPTPGMTDPEGSPVVPVPAGLQIMEPYLRAVKFAERLSVGVDYVRCDFMWTGRELFGGEITVYPAAGMSEPANASANAMTLNSWNLLESHFLKTPQSGWKRFYANALKRQLKKVAVRKPQIFTLFS